MNFNTRTTRRVAAGAAAVTAAALVVPLLASSPAAAAGPAVSLSPDTVTLTDSQGNPNGFSSTVRVTDYPTSQSVTIRSAGLQANCGSIVVRTPGGGSNPLPAGGNTDQQGEFVRSLVGVNCTPGSYIVEVEQNSTPFQTYAATLTLLAPNGSGDDPTINVVPSVMIQNNNGRVDVAVTGSGWEPGTTVLVSSDALNSACTSTSPSLAAPGQSQVVDNNGTFLATFRGNNCDPGTFAFSGVDINSPFGSDTDSLLILSSRDAGGAPRLEANPNPVQATTNGGNIAFGIQGRALNAFANYAISSTSLANACGPQNIPVGPPNATADANGNFTRVITASQCSPGTYTITAISGAQTVTGQITVLNPSGGTGNITPAITVSPDPLVPSSSNNQRISGAVLGVNFPSDDSVTLTSPQLANLCQGADPFPVAGTVAFTDLSGRFNAPFTGTDCAPGTALVSATENSAPFQTFTYTVTVGSPGDTTPTTPPNPTPTGTTPTVPPAVPPTTPPTTSPTTPPVTGQATSVTVNATPLVVWPAAPVISGVLRDASGNPLAGYAVNVQYKQQRTPGTAAFRTVMRLTTDANGVYSGSIRPTVNAVWHTVFEGDVDDNLAPSESGYDVTKVRVSTPTVNGFGSTLTVRAGTRVTVSGIVRPGNVQSPVVVQWLRPASQGGPVFVAPLSRTTPIGNYALPHVYNTPGTYKLRVLAPTTVLNNGAFSRVFTLRVV